MAKWLNEWRKLQGEFVDPATVVRVFECSCEPNSREHEHLVRGALRNANTDDYYLRDGVPISEA